MAAGRWVGRGDTNGGDGAAVRWVTGQHRLSRLRAYSAVDFDHH